MQQAADQLLPGGETPLGQRRGKMALALADPQQGASGSPRIADSTSSSKASKKPRLGLDRWLAATSRPAYAIAQPHGTRPQVRQAATNRAARDPVARDTAATPPRPAARASLAANNRRSRSSRNGESASKRAVIAAVSIMQTT